MTDLPDNSADHAADAALKLFDSNINMNERVGELEARRLLSHLEHANISDSVCEDTIASINKILYGKSWTKCPKQTLAVMEFIRNENKRWSKEGFRIIIEGGAELQRRRVMNFCLYRGIIARFASWFYIARTYDWPTIIPTISDFKSEDKPLIIGGMRKIQILGITELNLEAPRTAGSLDDLLTSILRGRMLEGKPTIITLRRPSWLCKTGASSEINDLVNTDHDEETNMVIRIRIAGGDNDKAQ